MFERFTDPARRAVVIAQEEARDRAAVRIGSEHLLLGLLAGPESPAVTLLAERGIDRRAVLADLQGRDPSPSDDRDALASLGIDLDSVRAHVEEAFGPGALDNTRAAGMARHPRRSGHIPFDLGTKKVLELALREAIRRGDRHVGTEHVLLGMLHGQTGLAERLLTARGLTLEGIRAALDTPGEASG